MFSMCCDYVKHVSLDFVCARLLKPLGWGINNRENVPKSFYIKLSEQFMV